MRTLDLEAVSITYRKGRRLNRAVRNVSVRVTQGETVALVGESGSGKSSLGRVMAGLQKPTEGTVRWTVSNVDVEGSETTTDTSGPRVQMVFQHPDHSLNPSWTVRRSIAEPLVRQAGMTKTEIRARTEEIIKEAGLGVEFLDRYPSALSGGQAQRVAVARAMISRPQVVVLDEPTASLDQTVRARLLTTLITEQQLTGVGYLLVTHDMATVRRMAHRILVMFKGQIVEQGLAELVLENPLHPYTRSLIAAVPPPDPRVVWEPPEISMNSYADGGSDGDSDCPVPGECDDHGLALTEVAAGHSVSCLRLTSGLLT